MKNLLFIIPHPDDEIVGCGIILKKFLEEGKRITLFFLTNGIIDVNQMWFWDKKNFDKFLLRRTCEMKGSLRKLGISDFICRNLSSRTLKNHIKRTHSEIKEIISKRKIDTIFCPAYEGGHQDHDVSNFICSRLTSMCQVFEFAEYNNSYNRVKSNVFIQESINQTIIELDPIEKRIKSDLLMIYESEKKNLTYVETKIESYRQLYPYDYSKPPHPGVLFYRRFSFFSWHPRVDEDHPSLICSKIKTSEIFNDYQS